MLFLTNLDMEWLAEEFPIGTIVNRPLLLCSEPRLGPLFFNPQCNTFTQLFFSPSLAPPFLSPQPPRLSLSRFLTTTCPSILPSTASSIDSEFGPQNDYVSSLPLSHNRLQLLHFGGDGVVAFFSTGENLDQIGFLFLSIKDGNLGVVAENEFVFRAEKRSRHRIVRILVQSLDFRGESSDCSTIGYLMAFTICSVDWFSIKLKASRKRPFLGYLGCKWFKSCSTVGACWSPHLPEECLVLLESGELFLFDVGSDCSTSYFKGTRLRVPWNDYGNSRWLGCEFSWHARVFIVARSDAVFLVDARSDEYKITCLAKIEILGMYASIEKQFLAFSKAGSDVFRFVLASDSLLVIYDVRRPLMPILQWVHNLDQPCFIDVFRLSELRSQLEDVTSEWATESGFCISLGSFWNCEFKLFCYGPGLPSRKGYDIPEISNYCTSLYAWELPSNFCLSGRECPCGSCLLREDFAKADLIDWQQKKEIVLGFGVLSKDLSSLLSVSGEPGGFMLIRLMSSGKLESQRYSASWSSVKFFDGAHGVPLSPVVDNGLYDMGDEEYKFTKRFKYLKFDYLDAFLNGGLSQLLVSSMKNCCRKKSRQEKNCSSDFLENLCEKLEIFQSCQSESRSGTSPAIAAVFDDISEPTSIREVASKIVWAALPMELLKLAFPSYSEYCCVLADQKRVSLEFLTVVDLSHLPPFFLRKPLCRSYKVDASDALVGPVVPLPVLQAIHKFQKGCPHSKEKVSVFSPETELDLVGEEVTQAAKEKSVSDYLPQLHHDADVSLGEDTREMRADSEKLKPFISYHPTAFEFYGNNGLYKDGNYTTFVAKVHEEPVSKEKMESVGPEMFDDLCPIKLKFDACTVKFGAQELKAYNGLKRKFAEWQKSFNPYQEFCTKFKLEKPTA